LVVVSHAIRALDELAVPSRNLGWRFWTTDAYALSTSIGTAKLSFGVDHGGDIHGVFNIVQGALTDSNWRITAACISFRAAIPVVAPSCQRRSPKSAHAPAINSTQVGISAICRYSVSRLDVFGSTARADDFNPRAATQTFFWWNSLAPRPSFGL
jgi:hypothetical protein